MKTKLSKKLSDVRRQADVTMLNPDKEAALLTHIVHAGLSFLAGTCDAAEQIPVGLLQLQPPSERPPQMPRFCIRKQQMQTE